MTFIPNFHVNCLTLHIKKIQTSRSVKINALPDRELTGTASSVSYEIRNPTRSASAGYLRTRSESSATTSPTLGRKISKKGAKAISRAKPTTIPSSNQADDAKHPALLKVS
jgi:hypothetical protein